MCFVLFDVCLFSIIYVVCVSLHVHLTVYVFVHARCTSSLMPGPIVMKFQVLLVEPPSLLGNNGASASAQFYYINFPIPK